MLNCHCNKKLYDFIYSKNICGIINFWSFLSDKFKVKYILYIYGELFDLIGDSVGDCHVVMLVYIVEYNEGFCGNKKLQHFITLALCNKIFYVLNFNCSFI